MNRGAAYRLTEGDVAAAAATLAMAFANYPTFGLLFPDAVNRASHIEHVMRFFLRCGLLRGEVLATSSKLEGISIWYRSPEASSGLQTAIRAGALHLFLHLGWRSFMRFKMLGDIKQLHRVEAMSDRCALLDLIGVGPSHTGKGFATELLEAKLAQLDNERQSAYLETSDPRNIGYYSRFGFTVVSSYSFQGIESFCMLRAPSTSA
jgi:GNAT superfamily N-acetyltransferase